MRYFFIFIICFWANISFAQYNSFKVLDNGDTINRVDKNGLKQGKWKLHVNALRLEPAYDEEGVFVDDKKEGIWRKYDMYGLLLAKESYKWGNKNGLQQYLYQGQLEHDENWRAIDPKQQYDTIIVHDVVDENISYQKIIKVESYSVEQGTWHYYDPETGATIKTEEYDILGNIVEPKKKLTAAVADTAKPKTPKPQAVLQFEKSKKGKKQIKVRDGATGY